MPDDRHPQTNLRSRVKKEAPMDLLLIDRLRGRYYDLLHNVDTYSPASIDELEIVGENKRFGTAYRATMPKSMRTVLERLTGFGPDTTFVDIGCGKGCTLLVASRFPFRKIVGVDFATELCRIAQKNISNYRGRQACKDISVLQMDATEFTFPDGPLLIYFFNPFHAPIMEKVLRNLSNSLAAAPRPVTLICDATYHRALIQQILQPRKIERICGFSVYEQADMSRWIPEELRNANSRNRA
jgi:SAM-dependent methyltransferase